MAVVGEIFPELNLVLYVAIGLVTPTEFFQVSEGLASDPRLRAGMRIILDFFEAALDTAPADLPLAISMYAAAQRRGQAVGPSAVLTRSVGLKHLGDALRVLSGGAVSNFGFFHTPPDALRWLGLPEAEAGAAWDQVRQRLQP